MTCANTVREGDVTFLDVEENKWKQTHYYLLTDMLLFTQRQKKKILVQVKAELTYARLRDLPDHQRAKKYFLYFLTIPVVLGHRVVNCWELHAEGTSLLLSTDTNTEKRELFQLILETIQKIKKN